ncbi:MULTISPECIES: hypothetical protein [unclassified Sphingobium]|uniref:hypothetical protein n=1 Tax=unclassified Sphingobium TaxID=2611147 RepID=UPI00119B9153|nr:MULTISPECIES: hypothetical protein [unclassified Sphingobium]TWC97593.1 hypothetical protein FB595_1342 [Sphingobium sp. AEW010]TWD17786.1 hypothetical protein FB596_1352 [Sphingobium sp. AEW013]TWD20054.1 hypothetical protein FB594_13520 [Sphingobium sp. AEW001]
MDDDSDDPVMALLATQRAVLAAVENMAGQVEAMRGKVDTMSGVLATLIAGSVGATMVGADRVPTLGDRFRTAMAEEAMGDPELREAHSHYLVAQAIAQRLHQDDPAMSEQETLRARDWIADQLDQGRRFDMAKAKRREDGMAYAVIEPIHEEMFGGRVRVAHKLNRER